MTNGAPDRFLVIRLSSLGDIIHAIPAVVALRRGHPSAHIAWVVEDSYREIVALCAPVDRVIAASTRRWARRPLHRDTRAAFLAFRREIRDAGRGATAIDIQGLMKSAALAWISGAPQRTGFARGAIREPLAGVALTRRVEVDRTLHVVDQNLALVRAVGALEGPADFSPVVRLADDAGGRVASSVPRDAVVVQPGAGRAEKRWPVPRFVDLCRALRERGLDVVVIWGPGEEQLASSVASGSGSRLAPETNLRELAFLMRGARLVVSGDSGPLHLAAALGTRVVALFGPTSVARNGPYGQLERCVTPRDGRAMEGITVAQVLTMIDGVMA